MASSRATINSNLIVELAFLTRCAEAVTFSHLNPVDTVVEVRQTMLRSNFDFVCLVHFHKCRIV